MLHIKHVNLGREFRGGERQTEMLIKALSAKEVRQTLFCRKNSALSRHLQGVTNLDVVTLAKPFFLALSKAKGADIIHGHENHGARFAAAAGALYGIPYIFTRRVDNSISNNIFNRYIYCNAARVVCLSSAIRCLVESTIPGSKCLIIPSMISDITPDSADVERIKSRFKGKILVGNAGALVKKHKGQHLIIDAARELEKTRPDIHFIFLGAGKDEEALKKQTGDITNVTFEGFKDNIADYLAAFDVFLFPSLMEGFGSVILDVMRLGTPVVTSDAGGIPDFVINRKNGLVSAVGNVDAMTKNLLEVIDDEVLRKRLIEAALKTVDQYTFDFISSKYLDLYHEIISG